jgi:two-component system sensor histidine kinase QseC
MKLLDRTLRTYLLYSAGVMLISTPVFYLVIEQLFTDQVDESLWERKQTIQQQLGHFPNRPAVFNWRDLEGNTWLQPVTAQTPESDTIYELVYPPPSAAVSPIETEAFRQLSARLSYRGQPVQLQTRISLVEKEDLLGAVVLVQTGLLTLLLMGLLLLNHRAARRLWHPFYQTLNRLQQYRVEQPEPLVLTPSATSEFDQLNQTLNQLTRRSHQTFLDQKEFTENAAHEMQTPVAVLQTRLERLTQTQPLTPDQSALIGSLNGITARLSRLNKSLLLLARVDNQHYSNVEPVAVVTLLNDQLSQSMEILQNKPIKLIQTGFADGPTLAANRTLVEIMLANLLTNAIRYTPPGGQITVQLNQKSLRIANTGEPLSIPADRLFARFQKGEAQTGGIGLGLAIAKKIADTYGYNLRYFYTDGQHQFVVWFG